MHFSRKRYRPLDAAEERAIQGSQRVQLLPLEDEQSYCFSWPEAPLTLWLREKPQYASLYQLIAGASTSGSVGLGASGIGSPTTGGASNGKDVTTVPSSAATVGTTRHQVDLPPVFSLTEGMSSTSPTPTTTDINACSGFEAGDGMHEFLRRIQREVALTNAAALSDETASLSSDRQARDETKATQAAAAGDAFAIAIAADAPRAAPHALAPPRPQSITEDSIFSLSLRQLLDLAEAGVPALMAAEEEEQDRQHQERSESVSTRKATHTPPPEQARSSSNPAMVVVIDEPVESNSTGGGAAAEASDRWRQLRTQRPLSAAHQHAIEQEVVGLEWRTWSQSQRTAAALQRLLSLEAAVPFEVTGDSGKDAWRRVVYRLWLRWRQQPELTAAGATPTAAAAAAIPQHAGASHSSRAVSSAAAVPSNSAPTALAGSVPPSPFFMTPAPPPQLPQFPQRHLPWGAPLLPGAYLYGTSNDYFICLPPSVTSTVGTTAGGSSSGGGGAGGSGNAGNATGTSMWPAMSRRRGVYSFLRWKVELYEAQMSRGENDLEEEEEDEEENGGENGVEGDSDTVPADMRALLREGKINRYAKGPLGSAAESTGPGQPRRRGGPGTGDGGDRTVPTGITATTTTTARRRNGAATTELVSSRPPLHHSLNAVMSAAHMKALIHNTVLTQPLTELQMDDEPGAVMERVSCPDLRHDTEAWRVWLSKA